MIRTSTASVRRAALGMTLIELLVSLTLLSALGGFLVQLMRNSMDLYETGQRRGENSVNGMAVVDLMADDLANVMPGTDGRLVIQRHGFGDGATEPQILVRLVRTAPGGEPRHPVLRESGTKSSPQATWSGSDPGPGARGDISPASGLIEVCYALVQDEMDDRGVMTLYRGVHSPVLSAGSFFDTESSPDMDVTWVRKNLTPVATGILFLRVLCWGPGTDEWGEVSVNDGRRQSGSAFGSWDSTRGMLEKTAFPLSVGPASLLDSRDDVYPRRVRIVATVTRPGSPDTKLRSEMKPGDRELLLQSTSRLPRESDEDRYVKVEGEWMEVARVDTGSAQVVREKRASGAPKLPVPAGTGVWVGKTFRRTVDLPFSTPRYGEEGQ